MSARNSYVNMRGEIQTAQGGYLDYLPASLANAASVAQAYQLELSDTPVEVTLPSNTMFFAVQPPQGNTVAITHRWAEGDTGAVVNKKFGIPACGVDASNLTFWLVAAASVTVTIWTW